MRQNVQEGLKAIKRMRICETRRIFGGGGGRRVISRDGGR